MSRIIAGIEGILAHSLMKLNCTLQKLVQTILVICCGVCMPWLLITKPLVIGVQRAIRKKKVKHDYHSNTSHLPVKKFVCLL